MSEGSTKGGFPLIACSYAHEVVCTAEIEFGVYDCATELLDSGVDEWEGMSIFYCYRIQPTIVYARMESAVLLLYKEEPSRSRRC